MARPIKETPVLEGKDARSFIEKMSSASDRKVSTDDVKRMRDNYERMKSIAKF
jgi:hypothetical protein